MSFENRSILFIPRVFDPDKPPHKWKQFQSTEHVLEPKATVQPADLDSTLQFSFIAPDPDLPNAKHSEVDLSSNMRQYHVSKIDFEVPGAPAPGTTIIANLETLPDFIDTERGLEWPAKTNVHCWWCVHGFKTRPIPCTTGLKTYKETVFRVKKVFCSFNCLKSHVTSQINAKILSIDAMSHNSHFLRVCHKLLDIPLVNLSQVKPAPPKESLAIFGGPLTIEEFRNNFLTLTELTLLEIPMIGRNDNIEWVGTSGRVIANAEPPVKKRKSGNASASGNTHNGQDFVDPTPVLDHASTEEPETPFFKNGKDYIPPVSIHPVFDRQLNQRMSEATARFKKQRDEQQQNSGSSQLRKAFEEIVKGSTAAADPNEKKGKKAHVGTSHPTLRNFLAME